MKYTYGCFCFGTGHRSDGNVPHAIVWAAQATRHCTRRHGKPGHVKSSQAEPRRDASSGIDAEFSSSTVLQRQNIYELPCCPPVYCLIMPAGRSHEEIAICINYSTVGMKGKARSELPLGVDSGFLLFVLADRCFGLWAWV